MGGSIHVERGDHVCWLRYDGTSDGKFGEEDQDDEDEDWEHAPRQHDETASGVASAFAQLVHVITHLVDRVVDDQLSTRMIMLAVYPPGRDAGFRKHLDNPEGDGRVITAVCYMNPGWLSDHGGILRAWTSGSQSQGEEVAVVPLADRLVIFFAECVQHEVTPNQRQDICPDAHRCAVTIWYYRETDAIEHLRCTARSRWRRR